MNYPLISHTVPVFNLAMEHVGNRLDASMGMPREAFDVIRRIVRMKIIEKEKGVQKRNLIKSECPF
jgi:hypothetical protein